jgi:ABC-type polysaccharide/polyol phosphate export permease
LSVKKTASYADSPSLTETSALAAVPRPAALSAPVPAARTPRRSTNFGGLIWTLVRTDFKTRYHGTLGGFVWALLKPLAMFLVLLAVFSFVFHSDPHYKQNLIVGLFLYDFFSDATKTALISLHSKGYLITKARFPSWIIVVTSLSNAVITLLVFVVFVLVFLTMSGKPPSVATAALFFWYQLHYVVIIIGFGLAASVTFLKYRDLNQVWDVISQAGFFVTPIVYPLAVLPERFHVYLYLWPPTPVIMFSRSVLVEGIIPTGRAHALLSIEALAILAIGAAMYRWRAPHVAEAL